MNQRPYSFLFSIVMHGVAIALVALGIIFAPRVKTPVIHERYAIRHLELHSPDFQNQQAAKGGVEAPRPRAAEHKAAPGGNKAKLPPVLRQQVAQAEPARQTLVQPDIPKPVKLPAETPVPTVVVWDAQIAPVKSILAPLPERPSIADVKPSIQRPNASRKLADFAFAPTDTATLPQPIIATTTSPIVIRGPQTTPAAAVTTANGSAQATSAAVMSLSDLQLANGDIALPPINESAASDSQGGLDAGRPGGGAGTGQGGGDSGNSSNPAAGVPGANGTGQGTRLTTTHVKAPKTGQFGAVIVGSTLEDKYPETGQIWSGRLAYTVYIHVGLAKSWILQYSLPREDEIDETGKVEHIEAPWPFNIVRPNLAPGAINADALMVHGFVNQAGRFEALGVVFPPGFEQAQFVIDSLAQWQFRPATQNGHEVKVEVLLIVPEEPQ
ncbi:MAG: hypothetical protein ABSE51_00395 [Terracidiphilus sp.]